MAAFTLGRHSSVSVTEAALPAKPKIDAIWLFIEKVASPWPRVSPTFTSNLACDEDGILNREKGGTLQSMVLRH